MAHIYYNTCKIADRNRNKDIEQHFRTCGMCGIKGSRTESEMYFPNTGNVYVSKEQFGDNKEFGLRARNMIPAGNKVMDFLSTGSNWIQQEGKKIYYGRIWTFLEYYLNYGGLANEKHSEIDETLKLLLPKNKFQTIQDGEWRGYGNIDQKKKNNIRRSKDTYKCACEMIHGVVGSMEGFSNNNGNFVRVQLQPYYQLPINMVGQGQLIFCDDDQGDISVLGIVTGIESNDTFVAKVASQLISQNKNVCKILTKMIADPTFVGFCTSSKGKGRPSPEAIHSKTHDAKFKFNVDGTLLKTYLLIVKNPQKTRSERQLARDILTKIGLAPFSNEPLEGTHASMIMPFMGVYNNIMDEAHVSEFPDTIRTTIHPCKVKIPQLISTYDIQPGEALTWLYGWKTQDYKVGYPPRRTVVYEIPDTQQPLNTNNKRRKLNPNPRFILDNMIHGNSTPQVVFQYDSMEKPILIPTVDVPNCKCTKFANEKELIEKIDKSGRCLVHNNYQPLFYGHDVEMNQIMHLPPVKYKWQRKYSMVYNNSEQMIEIMYGGVPYFHVKPVNGMLKIYAAKPFFKHEFFHSAICRLFAYSYSDRRTNMELRVFKLDVVRNIQENQVVVKKTLSLNIIGFSVVNKYNEVAVVTDIKIQKDTGNYVLKLNKNIGVDNVLKYYMINMTQPINTNDPLYISRVYDNIPHLQDVLSMSTISHINKEYVQYLKKEIIIHNTY